MSALPPHTEREKTLQQLLRGLISRVGGALEFWTVACLSQGELGEPDLFIDSQWNDLLQDVQAIRQQLADTGCEPSPAVQEQLAKLSKSCGELREVFDHFIHFSARSVTELEAAVVRLGQIWVDFRMRIALLSVLLPLPAPIPNLTLEQESYYQSILDGLYDRLDAARPKSVHDR